MARKNMWGKNSLDERPVTIMFRDINGKKESYLFPNSAAVYECLSDDKEYFENDEILLVQIGESVVYSALAHQPIDFEDLLGFFA